MKKSILTLSLFLAAIISFNGFIAQEEKAVAIGGAEISFDKETHDYGQMEQHANGQCVFVFTNTGTAPLKITNAKGSCGCTVPKCDKNPILPGQTSDISVKYDTKRVGPINKSVTITSNAVNEPTKVIRIKGKVEGSTDAGGNGVPVKVPSPTTPTNKK